MNATTAFSSRLIVCSRIIPIRLFSAALLALQISPTSVFAASGNFNPFLVTRQGAGGDVYTSATTGTSFDTINSGTGWLLEGGEISSWSDGGDSKTGADFFYRAYRSGSSAPSFSSLALNNVLASGNDIKWQKSDAAINLAGSPVQILGATYNGSYNIDYYYQAKFNWGSQFNSAGASTATTAPTSNFYTATYTLAGFDYYLDGSSGTTTQTSVSGGAATLTGSVGIGKFGVGTTQLTATGNNYTGRTLVAAGTLQTTTAGVVPDGSDVYIKSGATFDLNGNTETVASVREYGVSDGGSVNLGNGTLIVNGSNRGNISQNSITGSGGNVTFSSSGTTYYLYGAQGYTGTTTVTAGTVQTSVAMSSATFDIDGGTFQTLGANQISDTASIIIDAGQLTLGGAETVGSISGTGGTLALGANALTTSSAADSTYQGAIVGTGGSLTKASTGSLTLSGNNSYTGATTVSGGTLNLNNSSGSALGSTTSVSVANNAKLLISQSNQVNNTATVSLSGGTIQRASGVSETFGALNLTGDSTLDFGDGAVGNLTFGIYEGGNAPSNILTVSNFAAGNTLKFGNDVESYLPTGGALSNAYFSFNNGFTYDSSTFTITAIPEPSTYVAAAGLLAIFLWPVRRRMIKDLKSILGLRPTGRERIEAYRRA